MESDVVAVILIGGKSSRMGIAKHLLNYHGTSQIDHLYNQLGSVFNEVYISCNKIQAVHLNQNIKIIVDEECYGDNGPFTAVLSAFKKLNSSIFVFGCDYPFVNNEEVERLISARDEISIATCFVNKEQQLPEPLITIYELSCYDLLLENFKSGNYSLKSFLINNQVKKIEAIQKLTLKSVDTILEHNDVKNTLLPNQIS